MGAEYRYESYVTKPLGVDSYRAGGYFYPTGPLAGRPAQVGAQGAIVVTPEDAADVNRNIWAGYVDLALDVSPRFLVTAAGRFEHWAGHRPISDLGQPLESSEEHQPEL